MNDFEQCGKCKDYKYISLFGKNKNRKNGLQIWCKKCRSDYQKEHKKEISIYYKKWYEDNRNKLQNDSKKRYNINKNNNEFIENNKKKRQTSEYIEKRKAYNKKYMNDPEKRDKVRKQKKAWYLKNKGKISLNEKIKREKPENKMKRNLHDKNRKSNDIIYKLKCDVSRSVLKHLKKMNISGKDTCTFKSLTFTPKELRDHLVSTCKNYDITQKYHLDHIIPHCIFEYDTLDHVNFKLCWKLENLRYLPAEQNIKEKDRGFRLLKIDQIKEKMKQSGIYTNEEINSWIPPRKMRDK